MPATSAQRRPPSDPPASTTSLIDPEHDNLIPVKALAKQRLGKDIGPACVWRWRTQGVHGAKLEAVMIHGCWCTTEAAWGQFIRQQTAAASQGRSSASTDVGPRSVERTEKLKKAGLLK